MGADHTYVIAMRKPGEAWLFFFDGTMASRVQLGCELAEYAEDKWSLMEWADVIQLLNEADALAEEYCGGWE